MKHGLFRAVLFLCAVCLTVSLAGCFGGEGEGDTAPTTTTTTAATTVTTTTGPTAPAYPYTAYINATTLHVRPTPDTAGEAIGGLKFGDTVTVTGREGDWYCITFKGGVGYVNAQYVQDTVPGSTETTTTTTTVATTTTTAIAV